MNILVVDDDEQVLTLIESILGSIGHHITATTDAGEALEAIERGGIDLLMSDVLMPAMTGLELAAEARRRRPDLPVLFMSGSERVEGYPYLAKPFHTQGLLNALHQALAFSDPNAASEPGRPVRGARTPDSE